LGDIPLLGAFYRSSSSSMQKSNLILVLTPYIIREQSDLRTVFERKMQERQEFLDHYFVFAEKNEYQAPKDYSRANGLLEDIRQSYANADEQRRLDELTRPRDVLTHEPSQPIELPAPVNGPDATGAAAAPPSGAASSAAPASPAPPAPPTINVAPLHRGVERIEK
jgi:general secretion pathway protein D